MTHTVPAGDISAYARQGFGPLGDPSLFMEVLRPEAGGGSR